jgi:hypothetical protein
MSSKEIPSAQDDTRETAPDTMAEDDRDGSGNVAQKLSNELDNWRRQRNGAKPMRPQVSSSSNGQSSGPARTIKVRGHETLVVRKHKLPPKPESDAASD